MNLKLNRQDLLFCVTVVTVVNRFNCRIYHSLREIITLILVDDETVL